ncbi:cytochrome C, partial [Butyricicoccus sp. 1XD8-22]
MIAVKDRKLALWNIGIAYIAFIIGTFCGLLQVFVRNDSLQLPKFLDYYQILTAHGVLLALIFTAFFIFAFLIAGMSKTLGAFGPKVSLFAWIGLWTTAIGTTMATVM